MNILKKMCGIHAPSGNESEMTKFILKYIKNNQHKWKKSPVLFHGNNFQDNIIMVFGHKPKTAIFTHIDSIGFTVKYNNEILKIGSPDSKNGTILVGEDSKGRIEGKIINKIEKIFIDFNREIDRGTSLTFKSDFKEDSNFIECCYLDNRLGVWNALRLAESLENGIIVFSTYEEHGGGSTGYLGKFIQEKYNVKQALISDITWVTEGVNHGKGCAISIRDSGIPRNSFVNRIIDIVKKSKIPFQLEVEDSGGSDGNELQKSNYIWDWCFIGAPEDNVHSSNEKVHKKDIKSMFEIYKKLMQEL